MTEIKLTKQQKKRILNNFHYNKKSVDEIAQNLVQNRWNNINCHTSAVKIINRLIKDEDTFVLVRQRKEQKRNTLNWLNKPDSDHFITEEDLFEIPLPKEWKLQYKLQSSMNND